MFLMHAIVICNNLDLIMNLWFVVLIQWHPPPHPLWLLQLPDIKNNISTGVTIRLKKVWVGVLVLYVHELKLIILNNYQTTKF